MTADALPPDDDRARLATAGVVIVSRRARAIGVVLDHASIVGRVESTHADLLVCKVATSTREPGGARVRVLLASVAEGRRARNLLIGVEELDALIAALERVRDGA